MNKYYEKNLTTGNATSYYYLGDKLIAEREGSTLRYFHQDSLSSTSLITDASGGSLGTIKYAPFGDSRNSQGNLGTDILFTGQRLDDTGLYYYGARYYDSNIGRFISPDKLVQSHNDPQSLNRYSYVRNNPLKYVDPTGLYWQWSDDSMMDVWYEDDYVPPAVLTAEESREVSNRGMFIPGEPPLPIEDRLNVVQKIENAVILPLLGGEITDVMNTALAQAVPIIQVAEGGIADFVMENILHTDAVTVFPLGVFVKKPMELQTKAEEGFHWSEQKSFNPIVTINWFGDYVKDYAVSWIVSAGNPNYSHDAIPAERRAMQYAAQQTHQNYMSPPSLPTMFKNLWNKLWHH